MYFFIKCLFIFVFIINARVSACTQHYGLFPAMVSPYYNLKSINELAVPHIIETNCRYENYVALKIYRHALEIMDENKIAIDLYEEKKCNSYQQYDLDVQHLKQAITIEEHMHQQLIHSYNALNRAFSGFVIPGNSNGPNRFYIPDYGVSAAAIMNHIRINSDCFGEGLFEVYELARGEEELAYPNPSERIIERFKIRNRRDLSCKLTERVAILNSMKQRFNHFLQNKPFIFKQIDLDAAQILRIHTPFMHEDLSKIIAIKHVFQVYANVLLSFNSARIIKAKKEVDYVLSILDQCTARWLSKISYNIPL